MIRPDQAVVTCDYRAMPVDPSEMRSASERECCELRRSCEKPVSRARGVLWFAALSEIDLAQGARVKRRDAVKTPLAVAPRPRADKFVGCHIPNRPEVPSISLMHRQWIDPRSGYDVVR